MQGNRSRPSDVFQASINVLTALFAISFVLVNVTPHSRILDDTLIRTMIPSGGLFCISGLLSYLSVRATRRADLLSSAAQSVFALAALSLTLFLLVAIFE